MVAQVYPDRYDELLKEKVDDLERRVREAFAVAANDDEDENDETATAVPAAEVFDSARSGFRMRANFKMWWTKDETTEDGKIDGESEVADDLHENDDDDKENTTNNATVAVLRKNTNHENSELHYVMFERGDSDTPHKVDDYPMGYSSLRSLMGPLLKELQAMEELSRRINDVRFLTTLRGDVLLTVTYNRPIGDDWHAAATALSEKLSPIVDTDVRVVGRSRKVKLVVGGDTVEEVLTVGTTMTTTDSPSSAPRTFRYTQTEGAFTQPNARVCESMLAWAVDATRGSTDHDLCELYCGNGCFTVALADNFRRVVATEMSRASVELAEGNLARNGCDNVRVARLNAEDFWDVYRDDDDDAALAKHRRRLANAGIRIARHEQEEEEEEEGDAIATTTFDRLRTLFVDPPRAGLDETCRALAREFERVVYVSCNPETLCRDLADLADTHRPTRLAAFDQFPYTHHLEAGVVLERRLPRRVSDQ